ncbi:MRG-domain-containing protein [Cantharellus anzutake]|uniref:MRG-domain-containing protein n=1 Tax=Cantharellus anzutake TaxID=1750568 RepID=UPI0019031B66|nr:MRG-domain-containing protein [Cantharellus anzutake]KAF8337333.1 MRG-domain-containing protein [Cantharellus anzutake]
MGSTLNYQVGEKVLCYHGPVIYEAKVLKAEIWDAANIKTGTAGPHYFVHYKGWKQTWDEWVVQDRLLKYNDESLAMQKTINSQALNKNDGKTRTSAAAGGSSKTGSGGRRDSRAVADTARSKRKREEVIDSSQKYELKLTIPETIKVILVNDWEFVTKNNQLVTLPRKPCVRDLLEEFKQYATSQMHPSTKIDLLPTLLAGLQTYFDRSLGSMLLYRYERPQYAQTRKQYITGQHVNPGEEKEMSQVYGAEHLCRLFGELRYPQAVCSADLSAVKLPDMVAHTSMDEVSINILRDFVNDFMKWLVTQHDRVFLKTYNYPGPHYHNVART